MNLNREAQIHYTVAFIGGFLGIFPIVNAAHFFGSAQTVNLIDIIIGFLKCEGYSVLFHAIGVFLYAFAIFLVTFIPKHTKANVKILAMIVDITAAVVMWLFPIPKKLPLTVYLYPTFFAMSFQWCAFKGAYGFTSSTIFSSNNFRQFISSLTEIFFNGDKSFSLKAKFFGITLLSFHFGVTLSWILWHFLGNAGFLFVIIPCAGVTLALVNFGE
ncbi:YoaK family protein [uncultured Treponema sp.]|uniref:YoaK family protein n=1 Tax=uncultured Treponema sp. TaxID=162155 RepID=UPI0025F0E86D|nr:YoaK family protein [uncultured Treponema sp.]